MLLIRLFGMWLDTSVPSVKFKHLWTVLLEVLVATPLVITQGEPQILGLVIFKFTFFLYELR